MLFLLQCGCGIFKPDDLFALADHALFPFPLFPLRRSAIHGSGMPRGIFPRIIGSPASRFETISAFLQGCLLANKSQTHAKLTNRQVPIGFVSQVPSDLQYPHLISIAGRLATEEALNLDKDVSEPTSSSLTRVLRAIVGLCANYPRQTLVITLVITCLSGWYTSQKLELRTDRSDLIDPRAPFHQRWLNYTENFGRSGDLVVAVEASEPEVIKQVLDELGTELRSYPELFQNVLYKIEPGKLRRKGLQYLSPEQLAAGLERLAEYQPILRGRWELIRLENLLTLLQTQWEGDGPSAHLAREHAALLVEALYRYAEDPHDMINPWPELLPVSAEQRQQAQQTVYLLTETGRMGFLMAVPSEGERALAGAVKPIETLRGIIARMRAEHPDAEILLTGIPVLESDEMRRSQQDSQEAGIVSFVGVGVLLFVGLRGLVQPVLALITLAVGMIWSYGWTTLTVGHLNILSVAFASIVIGLGNDFAIHYLSRFMDLRYRGYDRLGAVVATAEQVGPGIATGAVTTAIAFLCAAYSPFLGVAELGIIAGGGVLMCMIATFIVLPALLALFAPRAQEQPPAVPFQGKLMRQFTAGYPGPALTLSGLVVLGALYLGCDWNTGWPRPRTQYDHNLLNLQARGLEAVEAQKKIFEASNNSVLYAISLADSAEEALRLKQRFLELPSVRHVEELASRLPAYPAQETRLFVQAYHAWLRHLPEAPPPFDPIVPARVGRQLEVWLEAFRESNDSLLQQTSRQLDTFLDRLSAMPTAEQVEFLTSFQYRLAYALLAQLRAIAEVADPEPVTVADLPEELRVRYVSPSGKWLLQIFPTDQVWDMAPLERFVKDVRSVDAEATGTPLQNYEAALQLKHGYEVSAIYALAVIMLLLLLDFLDQSLWSTVLLTPAMVIGLIWWLAREWQSPLSWTALLMGYTILVVVLAAILDRESLWNACLAMCPPLVGLMLTLLLLPVCKVTLNPANLIVLPLIIGIGVDYGVHLLHEYHATDSRRFKPSASMTNAIFLTSGTSILGFGSMMLAAHRGLYSLGAVLALGMIMCTLTALVGLSAMLSWMTRQYPLQDDQAPESMEPGDPGERILQLRRSQVA
ncbi:MAG: transporter [Planctomycetaceae bacterium]|nr:MAG: transporter [Planctomycetaceae bacterium]